MRGACRDIPVSFSSLRLVGYSPQEPFLFQSSTTAEVGVSDPKRDFFLPFLSSLCRFASRGGCDALSAAPRSLFRSLLIAKRLWGRFRYLVCVLDEGIDPGRVKLSRSSIVQRDTSSHLLFSTHIYQSCSSASLVLGCELRIRAGEILVV